MVVKEGRQPVVRGISLYFADCYVFEFWMLNWLAERRNVRALKMTISQVDVVWVAIDGWWLEQQTTCGRKDMISLGGSHYIAR